MRTEQAVPRRFDHPATRHFFAAGLWILTLIIFRGPLSNLVQLSLHDERSAHIVLIPLISAFLIWFRRTRIFPGAGYRPVVGIPLLLLGLSLWYGLQTSLHSLHATDRLSVVASLIVLLWIAGFILCYGTTSFKAAAFPLLFLLLMIPIPTAAIERAVFGLQKGSAELSYLLFGLVGLPVTRQGFRFSLPGVDIEISEQCSSIHSSISLFITGLLAGHVFLQATWKKVSLSLLTIPISIFKNAVRIVTISWLGVYWNPDFFHGALHQYGGLPFSLLALTLVGILLLMLRRPFSYSIKSGTR